MSITRIANIAGGGAPFSDDEADDVPSDTSDDAVEPDDALGGAVRLAEGDE